MTNLVKRTRVGLAPTLEYQGIEYPSIETLFDRLFAASPAKTSIYKGNINFASDIRYSEKEIVLVFELPAIDPKSLEIKVDNRMLTISAEKPAPTDDGYISSRCEIIYGKYMRSYSLPDEYDLDSITSTYKNGVLTINISRKPETLARQVQIKFD